MGGIEGLVEYAREDGVTEGRGGAEFNLICVRRGLISLSRCMPAGSSAFVERTNSMIRASVSSEASKGLLDVLLTES